MSKRAHTFELALTGRTADQTSYRWLYAALREQILAGHLRPGIRLPATRDLASQYRLSRGTIVRAFEELKAEGYIEGNVGSGTFVSRTLPDELLKVNKAERERGQSFAAASRRRISGSARGVKAFPGFGDGPIGAFRANLPAVNLFPTEIWAQIAARRLRRASVAQLVGCDAMGYLPLRRVLADYLTTSRGVKCAAEQVAIVAGSQEAIDLSVRLLVNPGDRVCMEDPGYPGAANVFASMGAEVSYVTLDDQGVRFSEKQFRRARLLYTTPGHQFPLGIAMSLPRRLQLLEWAQRTGAMIFEDDYDSEYRYSGRPVPALQGLDTHGTVLFSGSFSKVLFPSLRLGYLVVPQDLAERVAALISITTRHAPLLDQLIVHDFISEGHFGRHLRRMRQIYAERRSVLLEEAQRRLAGSLEISGVAAGLQTVGWLGRGIDAESAASAAASRKVHTTPLGRYRRRHTIPEGLQLGFAAFDLKEIRRGVQELAIALESVVR
ncbi:MAG TPA: PLP-dependent aminotransferase family protein [Terriglobales bacterium]|nr:PLP-dependent aminotransferase family protein [Terriglobales bacterium]